MKHEFEPRFVGQSTCLRCEINVFDSYKDVQMHLFNKVLRSVPDPKTGQIVHASIEEYRKAMEQSFGRSYFGYQIQYGREAHTINETNGKYIGKIDCISDEEYLIKKIIK